MKTKILIFSVIIFVALLHHYYLRGYAYDYYFFDNIDEFYSKVEEILLIIAILSSFLFLIYSLKKKASAKFLFWGIIGIFVLNSWSERIITDSILYLNTKIKIENQTEIYSVLKPEGEVRFALHNKKTGGILTFPNILWEIDTRRRLNGQKSMYDNENDTIHIPFKKGFLKMKFLEKRK